MPIFDNPKYWLSPLIIVWIYISVKDNHNRKKLLILIPLVIILSDQIGAQIKNLELKPGANVIVLDTDEFTLSENNLETSFGVRSILIMN